MKIKVVTIVLVPLLAMQSFGQRTGDCTKPSVLKLTRVNRATVYQLDSAKPHKLFTLGEVSAAIRQCSPEREIFVVASPDVPLSDLQLPSKEQITTARYFLQYRDGSLRELRFDLHFSKLPTTPDIVGTVDSDEAPPPDIATKKVLK